MAFVKNDDDLSYWREYVALHRDLSPYARVMLAGLSALIDRSTWDIECTQTTLANRLGIPLSTVSKHWPAAVEQSGLVEKVGHYEYQSGGRTMMGPKLRLALPRPEIEK